jgi:hypothetical protein
MLRMLRLIVMNIYLFGAALAAESGKPLQGYLMPLLAAVRSGEPPLSLAHKKAGSMPSLSGFRRTIPLRLRRVFLSGLAQQPEQVQRDDGKDRNTQKPKGNDTKHESPFYARLRITRMLNRAGMF